LRCAIVHYWLIGMRGGERVLEALCELFPTADIFTLFYEPEKISPVIRKHHIQTSFLNPLRRLHRQLLPLMPIALEHFDLRGYDLVISSESGPAKGVITSSNARHVCYCHSPMRYLWDLYPDYLHDWTTGIGQRALFALGSNYLRLWDYASAARVDDFFANSANVERRIWKAYRRTSDIVYPPVATETFYHRKPEDYFLVVSALVEYKRVRDAVLCFSRSRRRLKIVGEGPEYKSLRSLAKPNIEFCGNVSAAELRELYAGCRAVLLPGEEDFGIVPVEALASGKPVIALGRGGVLESVPVRNPTAGFFYGTPDPDCLAEAIERFEAAEVYLSPLSLQHAARRFSTAQFNAAMRQHLGMDEISHLASASKAAG
jgi:glycosyltransferase involved in cell wall biosynthesis